MPLISVNISCFNRSKMLKECLDSFINQTFKDFEIVVVDDGSEEDLSFVSKMDSRIKYYHQEHGGVAKGENLAMDKSQGKYILHFDSDDIALPELIEKEIEVLENNYKYDVVYCDHWLQKVDGSRIRIKYNLDRYSQEEFYQKMLERQLIAHGGTLWRKYKMPRYDESLSPADDWDLFITAIEHGLKFYHIPERLWVYRTGHNDRESKTKAMAIGCQKVLAKRKKYAATD